MQEILRSHLNQNDYEQYHPIADELTYYAAKILKEGKRGQHPHMGQLKTMLDFGISFDI